MGRSRYQVSRPVAIQIGNRISELLDEHLLTVAQLATKEGIAFNTVQSWVQGERAPSLGHMLHLVDVFELCSIEELIGGPLGTRTIRAQHHHKA